MYKCIYIAISTILITLYHVSYSIDSNMLPSNLKCLFRSLAILEPDTISICDVFLSTYGFHNTNKLAIRLTTLFKTLRYILLICLYIHILCNRSDGLMIGILYLVLDPLI